MRKGLEGVERRKVKVKREKLRLNVDYVSNNTHRSLGLQSGDKGWFESRK